MFKPSIGSSVFILGCLAVAVPSCGKTDKGAPSAQPARPPKPAPPAPPPAPPPPPTTPLDVSFAGEYVLKPEGHARKCALDAKTGGLVMSVGRQPRGQADATAACCVVFRSLDPGGRRKASLSFEARKAEPGLSVKLESFRTGYVAATFAAGPRRAGKSALTTEIADAALTRGVDRFCISVGQRPRVGENVLHASGLRFF